MLRALQQAVVKNLEKKQKLGQYAVVWRNGRPVQTGPDAPKNALVNARSGCACEAQRWTYEPRLPDL